MKRFATAISLLIILTIIITTGCAAPATTRPQPEKEEFKVLVSGELTAQKEGDTMKLHLKTDLMDGVIVRLSLESVLGESLKHLDVVKQGDNLKAEFDISDLSEDKVYAFAACAPSLYGDQPKEVYEKYGRAFQNVFSNQENVISWNNMGVFVVFTTGKIDL